MSGWKSTLKAFGSSAAGAIRRVAANKSVRSAVKKGLTLGAEFAAVSAVGALTSGSEGAREAVRKHALQSLASFAGVPDITSENEVADYMRETENKLDLKIISGEVDDNYKDAMLALEAARNEADVQAAEDQKVKIITDREKKMEEKIKKLKKQIMGVESAETEDGKRLVKRIQNLAGTMERELDKLRGDEIASEQIALHEKASNVVAALLAEIPEIGEYLRAAKDVADGMEVLRELSSLGTEMEGERKEAHKNISAVMAGIEGDVHRAAYKSIDEERIKTQSKDDRSKKVGVKILEKIEERMKSIHVPYEEAGKVRRVVKSGGLYGFIGGIGLHEVAIWCYYSPESSSEMFLVMFDAVSVQVLFRTHVVKSPEEAIRTLRRDYADFVKGSTGSVDLLHDTVQIQHTTPLLVGRFGDMGHDRMSENYYTLRKHSDLLVVGTSTHTRHMISDWLVNGPIMHEKEDPWGGEFNR